MYNIYVICTYLIGVFLEALAFLHWKTESFVPEKGLLFGIWVFLLFDCQVDELRDVGLQHYISLPRIAAIGTQSSGSLTTNSRSEFWMTSSRKWSSWSHVIMQGSSNYPCLGEIK